MIWVWITSALVLSFIPLINKKIDLPLYLWLLLPIESYGLNIAGATVRPYILFACILPIVFYAKNKGNNIDLSLKKSQLIAGIISILILAHSIFISNSSSAISGSILLILVYLSAQFSASCTDVNKCDKLCDVLIASCFGISVVYLVLYALFEAGIELSDVVTIAREEPGLLFRRRNMVGGKLVTTYRLRGFAYDPNAMFLPFFFGIPACISRIFKKFNAYHIVTLVTSIFCILLSSSRMGLICCILTIVVVTIIYILQFNNLKKKLISFVVALTSTACAVGVFLTPWGQQTFANIISSYTNRSSLTDEYGRFTIWAESLKIFWNENPLMGIGLTRMGDMTSMGRSPHNNWLQLLCECGLIVGGIAIVYFFSVMIYGWIKYKTKPKNDPISDSYLCILVGYTMTIVALISVDNYACSYLWFGALMLLQLSPYCKSPDNKLNLTEQTL